MSNHLLYPVYGFGSILLRRRGRGSSQAAAKTGEVTDIAEAALTKLSDSSCMFLRYSST